jgi:hypothetical protein
MKIIQKKIKKNKTTKYHVRKYQGIVFTKECKSHCYGEMVYRQWDWISHLRSQIFKQYIITINDYLKIFYKEDIHHIFFTESGIYRLFHIETIVLVPQPGT